MSLNRSCSCGWKMSDKSSELKQCNRCGRKAEKRDWGWSLSAPSIDVKTLETDKERKDYADSVGEKLIIETFYRKQEGTD